MGRIVKKPEDGTVSGRPGEVVSIQVEYRNNTTEKLYHLILSPLTTSEIEFDNLPVRNVEPFSNYTLNIPIKIRDNALPGVYELMYGMTNSLKKGSYGEVLIIKLRVDG